MGLKKFQLTNLSELNIGDRFYLTKNKVKVYQLTKKFRKSLRDNYEFSYMHLGKNTDSKKDKQVVYLRST